jgi:hypothetical protein
MARAAWLAKARTCGPTLRSTNVNSSWRCSVTHRTEYPIVADLYTVILHAALKGSAPHGREGIFFGENGEYRLLDAARAYTKALYDLGKSKTPDPVTFTEDEVQKYLGVRCLHFFPEILPKTQRRAPTWAQTRVRAPSEVVSSGGSPSRRPKISSTALQKPWKRLLKVCARLIQDDTLAQM